MLLVAEGLAAEGKIQQEIHVIEERLNDLEDQKHRLFCMLKRVLSNDEKKKAKGGEAKYAGFFRLRPTPIASFTCVLFLGEQMTSRQATAATLNR